MSREDKAGIKKIEIDLEIRVQLGHLRARALTCG